MILTASTWIEFSEGGKPTVLNRILCITFHIIMFFLFVLFIEFELKLLHIPSSFPRENSFVTVTTIT